MTGRSRKRLIEVAKAFSAYILAENIDDVLISENLQLIRSLCGNLKL